MIQTIIADDHPMLRRGLKDILEEQADIEVVAEAGNGQELLQMISQDRKSTRLNSSHRL